MEYKKYLTKKELADAFQVDPRTVNRWLRNGCPKLKGSMTHLRFDIDEVKEWMRRFDFHNS